MSKRDQVITPFDTKYIFYSNAIGELEGRILTFIDASISDPVQRKALKDLLRPMVWDWALENNREQYYELKEKPGSKPGNNI